jgi:hypothetical protein
LQHSKLSKPPQPTSIKNKFSSVLGADCAKVPIKHNNAKKMYKVAFRDTLFAWDPTHLAELKDSMVNNGFPPQSLEDSERLKQLKDIMREDGYSDDNLTNDDKISEAAAKYTSNSDDIDSLMYFNAKFFKKCIKQRILPPKELYWRVRAVFVTFGDMGDADTNKPLFNDTAWKKADNIVREILEGLISDPLRHSFYTVQIRQDGSPVTNKYRFRLLHCNRGTNDVENFHKVLITTFVNWHNGIEMSDCLLRERQHRHNQKMSETRRFGYPTIGHFDTWKIDQLQNLVELNHGVLLYPYWSNASDLKQTDESLGTVALHNNALESAFDKIPVPDDVHYSDELKYLMKAMGTALPVLPILTIEEKKLFTKLVLESPAKIDEQQMALLKIGVNT